MHQDGNDTGGATLAYDPDELSAEISRMQRKYLQGQKLLAGSRETDKGLRRRGHAPGPEFTARQAVLEQELDTLADRIRQAQAWYAALGAAGGGDPLTPEQAEQFLLAIEASDSMLALHRKEPEEMTAMLNRSLATLGGSIEARFGLIATHMRQDAPGDQRE